MKSCKIENCCVQSVICETRENWHVNFINKVSSEINLYLLIWLFMESLPEWVNKDWVENFEVSFTIEYKAFLFWAPEFLFQYKMLLQILIPNM